MEITTPYRAMDSAQSHEDQALTEALGVLGSSGDSGRSASSHSHTAANAGKTGNQSGGDQAQTHALVAGSALSSVITAVVASPSAAYGEGKAEASSRTTTKAVRFRLRVRLTGMPLED